MEWATVLTSRAPERVDELDLNAGEFVRVLQKVMTIMIIGHGDHSDDGDEDDVCNSSIDVYLYMHSTRGTFVGHNEYW